MANITEQDGKRLYILALANYTPQEMANKYPEYHADQIRNYLSRKFPDLKGNITKDISRGNTKLKSLLQEIFNHDKIEVEFSIGKGLRLDCYIAEPHNLGFEYDGVQHTKSVDHFGGEEAYIKNIQNDQLKEELCKGRGINLIRISHTEEVTIELLKQKIDEVGPGSGYIKEGFQTNKEKKKEKNDRLSKKAKEIRSESYQKNKQRLKNSDQYKASKERQRAYRKEQYKKAKAWQANRSNKPR